MLVAGGQASRVCGLASRVAKPAVPFEDNTSQNPWN